MADTYSLQPGDFDESPRALDQFLLLELLVAQTEIGADLQIGVFVVLLEDVDHGQALVVRRARVRLETQQQLHHLHVVQGHGEVQGCATSDVLKVYA